MSIFLFMFSVSWLTAFKIICSVDEDDDELQEESLFELVTTIFHSAVGCVLSIVCSDSLSFKII